MPASYPCCCVWCRVCRPPSPVKIKLHGDAGFTLPLLYRTAVLRSQYTLGIPANSLSSVAPTAAEAAEPQLSPRPTPAAQLLRFRHRAAAGRASAASATKPDTPPPQPTCASSLPLHGPASQVFTFYNDHGGRGPHRGSATASAPTASAVTASWPTPSTCSCTPPLATWSASFTCVPQPWRSAQIETLRAQLSKSALASATPPAAPLPPGQRLAFRTCSIPLLLPSTAVDPIRLPPNSSSPAVRAEPCPKTPLTTSTTILAEKALRSHRSARHPPAHLSRKLAACVSHIRISYPRAPHASDKRDHERSKRDKMPAAPGGARNW